MDEKGLSGQIRVIELLEQAVYLVRSTSVSLLWIYYLATIPFIIFFINFIYYSSKNLITYNEIAGYAILLSIFFWIKETGQSIYCKYLSSNLMHEKFTLSLSLFINISIKVIFINAIILLLLPEACMTLIFLGYLTIFSQHILIFTSEAKEGIFKTIKRGAQFTKQESFYQHSLLLVLLIIYSMIVVNVYFLTLFLPYIIKKLFNIHIIFDPFSIITIIVVLCASYLIFDPIFKCCFVILSSSLKSRTTGEDIIAECRMLAKKRGIALTAIFLFCFIILASPSRLFAQNGKDKVDMERQEVITESTDPNDTEYVWLKGIIKDRPLAELNDKDIRDIKERIKYTKSIKPETISDYSDQSELIRRAILDISNKNIYGWKDKRQTIKQDKTRQNFILQMFDQLLFTLKGWLAPVNDFIKMIIKKISKFIKRIFNLKRKREVIEDPLQSITSEPGLIITLVILLFLLLVIYVFKSSRKEKSYIRRKVKKGTPDLSKKDVDVTQLKEKEWLELGEHYKLKGELALALRTSFLAILSSFHKREYITFKLYKTNYNYLSELKQNVCDDMKIIKNFQDCIETFERIWYGGYPASKHMLQEFEKKRLIIMKEG